MIPDPPDPWRHFLRSERSGRSSAADEALRELFRALPQHSPGAGFVERVMARVARPSWSESRWARWTVAASLAAAALAVGLLLPALLPLARLVAPGELLSLWIRAVADLSAQFGESLGVWQQWMRAGGSVARALAGVDALRTSDPRTLPPRGERPRGCRELDARLCRGTLRG